MERVFDTILCDFKRFNDGRDIKLMQDNEMSQDQVYGIILGLYAVIKFVPGYAAAKPKPTDDYINFHAYAKHVTHEIVSYCASEKTVKDAFIPINDGLNPSRWQRVSEMRTTWFIHNKNNGDKQVWRGSNLWGFAYPISKIAQDITGQVYDPRVIIKFPKLVDKLSLVGRSIVIPVMTGTLGAVNGGLVGSLVPVVGTAVGAAAGGAAGVIGGVGAVLTAQILRAQLYYNPEWIWNNVKKVAIALPNNHLATQMILKVAALEPASSNSAFNSSAHAVANSEAHSLIRNQFHSSYFVAQPQFDNFWQNRLSQAYCFGAGKTETNQYTTPVYWQVGEVLSLTAVSKPPVEIGRSERVGLGYMLMHNLWRLSKGSSTGRYEDEFCPCFSTDLVTHDNYDGVFSMDLKPKIDEIGGTLVTRRKYSDYADVSIGKSYYVTHDVEIKNNGLLRVAGDLTVCGSEMRVKSNGEVFIPNTDPDYPTVMEIDNGGRLAFESSSKLRIGDKSKLLIGSNGFLDISNNVTIILDGPEANLVIEGELVLQNNAKLTIQSGTNGLGYITFRKHIDPNNGNKTFAKITGGVNSSIEIIGVNKFQKVLQVDGNFGVIIPESIASFSVSNGAIEMGKMSRMHVASALSIRDCQFNTKNNTGDYRYFAGIMTAGQPNVEIKDCVFKNGKYGVLAINFYSPRSKPQIDGCYFEGMITGIQVEGGGVDIKNTNVNRSRWNFVGEGIITECVFEEVYLNECWDNYFTGSSNAVLSWYKGDISRNYHSGMDLIGGTFKPKCVSISNNIGNGITTRGTSFLSLSSHSDAGYNNIDFNDHAGIFNRGVRGELFGAGQGIGVAIDLKEGYNSFNQNGTYAIDAVLDPSSISHLANNYFLVTSKNYWGSTNPPVDQVDYDTYYKPNWGSLLFRPQIATNGLHLISSSQHFSSKDGVCFEGIPGGYTGGGPLDCTDVFLGGNFDTRGVLEVLGEGKVLLFNDNSPELAMSNFEAVALHDFDCPGSDDSRKVAYESYRNYMIGYAKLLGEDSIDLSRRVELADNSIVLINSLLTTSEESTSEWDNHKLMLGIDLADCYRAKDDRQTAINLYDNMLVNPEFLEDADLISYYRCIADGELRVLNGDITIYEKLEQYSCPFPIDDINHSIIDQTVSGDPSSPSSSEGPVLQLLVHPNPTNGQFTLTYSPDLISQFSDQSATIIVADGYGVAHQTLDNVNITLSTSIDLSGYPAGIYHIQSIVGNQLFTKYLILTNQ